jgi:hypothetical protein
VSLVDAQAEFYGVRRRARAVSGNVGYPIARLWLRSPFLGTTCKLSQCVSGAQRRKQILRSFSGGGSGAHCRSVYYYRGGFIGFWNNTRVWRLVGPCSYAYGSMIRAYTSGV